MKKHRMGCMANLRCAVYHEDGICPGPYGKCTCDGGETYTPANSSIGLIPATPTGEKELCSYGKYDTGNCECSPQGSVRERFERGFEKFVEYSEEGRRQIARNKEWYNGHTDSHEYTNEVDEIKDFFLSFIEEEVERSKEALIMKFAKDFTQAQEQERTATIKEIKVFADNLTKEHPTFRFAFKALFASLEE